MDELLDLVDQDDKVIGQKLRSEIYAQGLCNFRVVNAFLINQKGQLWIPRRSANKLIFPLCLDASMGGHVSAGETYDQAFKRELMEELNIDANLINYQQIASLNPYEHNTSAFMRVYLIHTDNSPAYNTSDFIEYLWVKPQELLNLLKAGDKSKDDLPKIVELLLK